MGDIARRVTKNVTSAAPSSPISEATTIVPTITFCCCWWAVSTNPVWSAPEMEPSSASNGSWSPAIVYSSALEGPFMLDTTDRRPRLPVATGSGLAPMIAMLESAFSSGERIPTVLIHGVSFHGELAYRERIQTWLNGGLPLDYRPTVSRPREDRNAGWSGRAGRAETQLDELMHEWRWLRGRVRVRAAGGPVCAARHPRRALPSAGVTHKLARRSRSLGVNGNSATGASDRRTLIRAHI